jgi:hypothetical protein
MEKTRFIPSSQFLDRIKFNGVNAQRVAMGEMDRQLRVYHPDNAAITLVRDIYRELPLDTSQSGRGYRVGCYSVFVR